MEGPTIVWRINVYKNHYNKTFHLLVEISNHLVKGFMDTNASMSAMFTGMVCELGIVHLVSRLEYYETTFRVVTQTFNKTN